MSMFCNDDICRHWKSNSECEQQGTHKMSMFCNNNICRHWKCNSECRRYISSLNNGECDNYDELSEEELFSDIYYIRTKPEKVGKNGFEEWIPIKGRKIKFIDREMFENWGYITDGRTGTFICYESSMDIVLNKKDEAIKKLVEHEKQYGISPLYK